MERRDFLKVGACGGIASLLPGVLSAADHGASKVHGNSRSYHFNVGDLELISISDAYSTFKPVHPLFAPEATADEVKKVLSSHLVSPDELEFHFNILVVKKGNEVILIDTGYGEMMGAKGGKLTACLKEVGVPAKSVSGVIITHGHPDHVGALLSSGGNPFPAAEFFINGKEYDFWTGKTPDLSGSGVPDEMKTKMVAGAQNALTSVKFKKLNPGDKVFDVIELVDAAGHTPGHLGLRIRSGEEELFHIADLAHNFVLMFARPDWTVAFDVNPDAARSTRRKIFSELAKKQTRVMGYHMPFPGVGRIAGHGESYVWIPEPWRPFPVG